jgi:hypothetical protein
MRTGEEMSEQARKGKETPAETLDCFRDMG